MVKKSNKKEEEKKVIKGAKKVTDTKKTKKIVKKDNKTVKVKKKPFAEFKSEFSKIKWPTKKDMIKYSIATLSIIVFFCLFFVASDLIIMAVKELMK